MSKKVLTVAIAAYNVEKYLNKCLDSFCDKRFNDDLEVLIVNDGSKDSTAKIASQYSEKNPAIFKLIDKENGGWGSTINYGVKNASGKYFYQLDGDDYCDAESMLELIDILKSEEADIVLTDWQSFEDKTEQLLSIEKYLQAESCGDYSDVFKEGSFPSIHSLCVKTSVFNNISILEHCFYTDVEYVFKTASVAKTYHYMPINVYKYRVGRSGQSISFKGIRKHYGDHKKVILECLDYLENVNVNNELGLNKYINKVAAQQYTMFMICPTTKEIWKELLDYNSKINHNMDIRIDRAHSFIASVCSTYIGYVLISKLYKNIKRVK